MAGTGNTVVLELADAGDPLAGPGAPPRDADLRLRLLLKRALRDYGLRCRRVCDGAKVLIVTRDEAAAATAASEGEVPRGDG